MKKYTRLASIVFLFLCILLLPSQKTVAQVSGVKNIPGDYTSINAAIQDIMLVGLTGNIILELQPGYTDINESFPITIPERIGRFNSTITIRPAALATNITIGSGYLLNTPIFEIFGSYITIDGRPGGTGTSRELKIVSKAIYGSTIQFSNNAGFNTATFCRLEGLNDRNDLIIPGGESGVVVFYNGGPFPGNTYNSLHDNIVSNCIIRRVGGTGNYTNGILAYGNPDAPNIGNKIMDNEIEDFEFRGIKVLPDGIGSSWTITGNSFYHFDPIPIHGRAIQFEPGANSGANTIDDNFIGGNAPRCGGKMLGLISGIFLDVSHSATTSVKNNSIKNIHLPVPSGGAGNFTGIYIKQGRVECSGNLIGGTDADFGIELTSTLSGFKGIVYDLCGPGSITQNTIRKIKLASSFASSTLGSKFFGIQTRPEANITVSQNLLEQLNITSAGPSIITAIGPVTDPPPPGFTCLPSPATVLDYNLIKNISLSSDDGNSSFTGIELNGTSVSSEATLLHNNEVYKINVSSPNGAASFAGLSINDRIAANTGNIIGSATEANSIMVTGKSATANGIRLNNSPDVSISDDIIANITANGTLTPASINGILFNGGALAKISGNNIHHLTSPQSKGIFIQPVGGSSDVTIEKNIITGLNTSTGTGIETFVASEASLHLTATNNTISNWQTGVLLAAANGATLVQSFQNNSVVNNQTGFINENGTAVNATCNWWGHASGPSGAGPGTGNPVGANVIFNPWATIEAYVAVNAGADQTIYIGYGPTSKTLTPTVTVCGTPTFLWSTGATTAVITVSPTATTVYSVTVKDANGHEATDQVTVFVNDVRCGNNNNKVLVCHKESATKKKPLCISASDVAAHLAHGDVLGDCTTGTGARNSGNGSVDTKNTSGELTDQHTIFKAYPNPAFNQLQLQWKSEVSGMATLKVIDVLGRTVFTQRLLQTKGNNYKQLLLPGLINGNYFLLLQSGEKTNTQKIFIKH